MPVQILIGAEGNFLGVADLFTMRTFIQKDEIGKDIEETDIPKTRKPRLGPVTQR